MVTKQITVHLFHLLDNAGKSVGWLRRHFDGPKSWWVAHHSDTGTERGDLSFDLCRDWLEELAGAPASAEAPPESSHSRFSFLEVD